MLLRCVKTYLEGEEMKTVAGFVGSCIVGGGLALTLSPFMHGKSWIEVFSFMVAGFS